MPPPNARVSLAPFGNVDDAISMVASKYADRAQTDSDLARYISATEAPEWRRLHRKDRLRAICAAVGGRKQTVGLG